MKQIAQSCFIYGSLAFAGALIWYLAALTGHAVLPQKSVWVLESLLIVHAIVMVITFYRRPSRVLWAPVLPITAKRLRAAKILLITAAANFVFSVVLVAWERRRASERALSMVLTSFALLNATYIAIHWAFRPENIFTAPFLAFISNPILYVLSRLRLRRTFTSASGTS